jgi:FemAB-related protein (PEP-CTERM system-associated)
MEESFRYRPYYLVARDSGGIRAVLPLFLIHNRFLGKALISSPFAVYGGILAASASARDALYGYAKGLGEELGVDYIELRNAWPEQCAGISNVSRYVTFTQDLAPDEAKLLESLPKKTRNMVRKSLKQPFRMEYNVRDAARLDAVHSRNMRRLGTPNFPRKYFASLLANFGEMADVREVWLDRKVIAVSLNFYYHGEMHTYHAAADSRFNALGPNTFMYFDHLRWAGQHGLRIFDFGRSKRDTGTFEFKKHWNTGMRELPYEIILVRRANLPNFSPANPRFEMAIRVWRRLPLAVTRMLSRFVFPLFP